MIRIVLITTVIVLLVIFLRQLRFYLARDRKIDELKATRLKTHMKDIDKEIVKETQRQKDIDAEIDHLTSEQSPDKKENDQ
jgi:uncharacterized membrane protein YhiD involved in acid resistance